MDDDQHNAPFAHLGHAVFDVDSLDITLSQHHIAASMLGLIKLANYAIYAPIHGFCVFGEYQGMAVCIPSTVNRAALAVEMERFSLQPLGKVFPDTFKNKMFRLRAFTSGPVLALALEALNVPAIRLYGWGLKLHCGAQVGLGIQHIALIDSACMLIDLLLSAADTCKVDIALERKSTEMPRKLFAFKFGETPGMELVDYPLFGTQHGGAAFRPVSLSGDEEDEDHFEDRWERLLVYTPLAHVLKKTITERETWRPDKISHLTKLHARLRIIAETMTEHQWMLSCGYRLELRVELTSIMEGARMLIDLEDRVFGFESCDVIALTREAYVQGLRLALDAIDEANTLRGARAAKVGEQGQLVAYYMLNYAGFVSKHLHKVLLPVPNGPNDWRLDLPTLHGVRLYSPAEELEFRFMMDYLNIVSGLDAHGRPGFSVRNARGHLTEAQALTAEDCCHIVLNLEFGKDWLGRWSHREIPPELQLHGFPNLTAYEQLQLQLQQQEFE